MTDTPARLIAAIARDLNHGCAVTDEVACEVKTLGELTTEFELAAQENDRTHPNLPAGVRWTWKNEELSHTTNSGRMKVITKNNYVVVTIKSGTEGYVVVQLMFNFNQTPGESACTCKFLYINPSVLVGRSDRIWLLIKPAFHEVHTMCERNAQDKNPSNDVSTLAGALRECLLSQAEYQYAPARYHANLLLPNPPDQAEV